MLDRNSPEWRTSSRSSGGACVEVKATEDEVLVRDSKDRGGPVLRFDHDTFRAFIADLKAGGAFPE
ncbi:hypothetical protein Ade02nite_42910 [Paractinoplanes deccanensis]|uniref:DUF397 domain-containing protein n=2 Tax=Paractinoplanes deccanensis TaxID=113561 RepID=A0ABQ3Y6P8_9ACTN|nr:DUF397 domain-containing protein [Actinoplanes deccanensis]GID75650.1 hypothetical protein Ade02nite_42910 [Actinoplanes deccanensis]